MKIQLTFVSERICGDMYHPEDLEIMETEILHTLGWRLNGPTPCDFIHHFVELLPLSADKEANNMLVRRAVQNSELAMLDYSLALGSYSVIALAAISALSIKKDDVPDAIYEELNISRWTTLLAYLMHNIH